MQARGSGADRQYDPVSGMLGQANYAAAEAGTYGLPRVAAIQLESRLDQRSRRGHLDRSRDRRTLRSDSRALARVPSM